jgi:hypothetical protein
VTYRIFQPMLVLAFKDNHQAAITVQAGQIIDVIGVVPEDDRFVIVSVHGDQFHAFASDLADRGKLLSRLEGKVR